ATDIAPANNLERPMSRLRIERRRRFFGGLVHQGCRIPGFTLRCSRVCIIAADEELSRGIGPFLAALLTASSGSKHWPMWLPARFCEFLAPPAPHQVPTSAWRRTFRS